ncbi:MAG: isochorismatase family protein [Planctomycetes bacterium]|nr:isochorismatase family protein [Planctomycetota bacterium]
MIRPVTIGRKRVIVDVDTQMDLFVAHGSACIRNHRRVLANIRRIAAWARVKRLRTVSTEICFEAKNGHNYCIAGTKGQQKIPYTLRNRRISFAADSSTDLARDIFLHYDQIILNKRCEDPFEEPRAERIFTELRADEFIVIGALAESAVLATVLGLLSRGKRVTVMVDAVGTHNRRQANIALRKMQAKGAKLIEAKKLVGEVRAGRVGACGCKQCMCPSGRVRTRVIA